MTSTYSNNSSTSNTNYGSDNDVKYEALSYDDVQTNLRVLADLKEGEKIIIKDSRYIVVDQRIAISARRWLSADSRTKSIGFIEHVISEAKRYCDQIVYTIRGNSSQKEHM